MNGKMIFPLKGVNEDCSKATINVAITVGTVFNGIRVDHIARVGDHFEMAYTVTDKETEKLLACLTCNLFCGENMNAKKHHGIIREGGRGYRYNSLPAAAKCRYLIYGLVYLHYILERHL